MIQVSALNSHILKFPTSGETTAPAGPLTLRDFYTQVLLPDLDDLSPRSLDEDRVALNNWERYTPNKLLSEIDEADLMALRDGMLTAGRAPSTVAKTWRELRAMLAAASDDGLLATVPKLKRRSRIVKLHPKRQRETVNETELTALWRACKHATYPADNPPGLEAAKLWRVALVLFWTYGPRTGDVFNLTWDDVRFGDRLLQFRATKTGKLQGLPLTDLVIAHLRSIKTQYNRRHVFAGFRTPGCHLRTGRWKAGYYATWRADITAHCPLKSPIVLKHFRERMVTFYNGREPGLGSWIAGHSMPGVSAQHYDLPTQRIRDAIAAAPVPECFREIG